MKKDEKLKINLNAGFVKDSIGSFIQNSPMFNQTPKSISGFNSNA